MRARAALLIACLLLAATLLVFEATTIDLWLQDFFYSSSSQSWLVSKNARLPRILFYHGPKCLLIGFGAWLLLSLITPGHWIGRKCLSSQSPRQLIYLLMCLAFIPTAIGAIKDVSGLHCPSELSRYGGRHEYRKLFAARFADPNGRGDCFPAGHSSGGFALLGLWFVAQSRSAKKAALAIGLGAGWAMGGYQMLNGSHFLSHTVVTMMLAWIFALSFALLFRLARFESGRPDQPMH